jgi:hypothetical protein
MQIPKGVGSSGIDWSKAQATANTPNATRRITKRLRIPKRTAFPLSTEK